MLRYGVVVRPGVVRLSLLANAVQSVVDGFQYFKTEKFNPISVASALLRPLPTTVEAQHRCSSSV